MAIISSDNKILVNKRTSNIWFPNAVVLPGGHLELGESLEECVIREVLEETGLQIDQSELVEPFFLFESAAGRVEGKSTKCIAIGHLIVFYKVKL